MASAKPLGILATGQRGEIGGASGYILDASALGIDVGRFLQAINSTVSVPTSTAPTPVDAMEQSVVQPNHGDTTNIVFNRTLIAYPGGAFEQLVMTWLTGTLGQSTTTATSTIASIRAAALAITP